uniref:Uncharacterized protein n=1 Tax=Lepeophtheirus salmonis TaxID=72036 RepID=A0A0K2SYC7_LEPSM
MNNIISKMIFFYTST